MKITEDFFNLVLDFGDEWVVKDVETDHKQLHIYLYLEYISDHYEDPDTMEPAVLYDHCEMREWRHLDILHYQTYVRCRIPRVKCKDGKVKQIAIGWANKHDRHSFQFEKKVIDLLLATKNQSKTAQFLGCSFRLVNRILHRCVERGLERRSTDTVPFEHISIDEKSFKKGHKYVTVLSHPRSGVVLNVGENRDVKSTRALLTETFTQQQLNDIKTVSMDMWQAYINSITAECPNAELVHDKFHLVAYLNKGIDQVRRREVKKHDELKHSRYVLLKNQNNLTQKQYEKFELIRSANYQVSKAWHIRENFRDLFGCSNNEMEAKCIFQNWIQDSYSKCIKEVNKVIEMFVRHAGGVINALITNLNNAMAERLNGKIQELKTIGKGYRMFDNFRSAILFFYGGLSLYPLKW